MHVPCVLRIIVNVIRSSTKTMIVVGLISRSVRATKLENDNINVICERVRKNAFFRGCPKEFSTRRLRLYDNEEKEKRGIRCFYLCIGKSQDENDGQIPLTSNSVQTTKLVDCVHDLSI